MEQRKIGKFIATERKTHGFTQHQLADRLGIIGLCRLWESM
nr:hypothetical protein [uncultured Sellimonas sp.]